MKKAIVVGATSGIGKGLARILAENNYKVGITGRRTELLEQLKTQRPEAFVPDLWIRIWLKATDCFGLPRLKKQHNKFLVQLNLKRK